MSESGAAAGHGGDRARAKKPRWRRIVGHPVSQLVIAFVVVALIQAFLVKPYVVPSLSMAPTFQVGDRIIVDRAVYVFSAPQPGDAIVFNASSTWEAENPVTIDSPIEGVVRFIGEFTGFGPGLSHTLTKRVVAGPGQTVACCTTDGRITVDGVPVDEPYIVSDIPFEQGVYDCETVPRSTRCFDPFTVPEGQYFVLGDNRANSSDSIAMCRGGTTTASCVRTVRREDVVGRVFAIAWPNPHFLPNESHG